MLNHSNLHKRFSMIITIETSDIHEVEQLLKALKLLNIKSIKIKESPATPKPIITRGNKKLDPKALFGIWQNKPRTIEQIRSTAFPPSIIS